MEERCSSVWSSSICCLTMSSPGNTLLPEIFLHFLFPRMRVCLPEFSIWRKLEWAFSPSLFPLRRWEAVLLLGGNQRATWLHADMPPPNFWAQGSGDCPVCSQIRSPGHCPQEAGGAVPESLVLLPLQSAFPWPCLESPSQQVLWVGPNPIF